ncbi:hypothetical protein AAGG52_21815 [Bacillus licheniformis]
MIRKIGFTVKKFTSNKKEDELIGEITKQTNQKQYLSYKENNNKFSIPPKNKLIDIKNEYKYEFYFRAQMSEGIELIPMIVGYANDKKFKFISSK